MMTSNIKTERERERERNGGKWEGEGWGNDSYNKKKAGYNIPLKCRKRLRFSGKPRLHFALVYLLSQVRITHYLTHDMICSSKENKNEQNMHSCTHTGQNKKKPTSWSLQNWWERPLLTVFDGMEVRSSSLNLASFDSSNCSKQKRKSVFFFFYVTHMSFPIHTV